MTDEERRREEEGFGPPPDPGGEAPEATPPLARPIDEGGPAPGQGYAPPVTPQAAPPAPQAAPGPQWGQNINLQQDPANDGPGPQAAQGGPPFRSGYLPGFQTPTRQNTPMPQPSPGGQVLNAEGNPDAHLAGIMAAQQRVQQATLSPSENLTRQRYQQGLATVDQQVADGTLTPQQGQAMRQQIQQAAAPLMIRASELPIRMMQLQYQQMQHQAAQQAAVEQQNAQFRASTAQQRVHTVSLPDGSQVHYMETRPGHLTPIVSPRNDPHAATAAAAELRAHSALVQHHMDAVQHEALAAARPAGATGTTPPQPAWLSTNSSSQGPVDPTDRNEQIRREVARRVDDHYRLSGTTPPASTQPQPRPQPSPTPPAGGQPQTPPPLTPFSLDSHPNTRTPAQNALMAANANTGAAIDQLQVPAAQRTELQQANRRLLQLVAQHGPHNQMPTHAAQEYSAIEARLARALGRTPAGQVSLGGAPATVRPTPRSPFVPDMDLTQNSPANMDAMAQQLEALRQARLRQQQ